MKNVKILNNIDESYFLNDEKVSLIDRHYFDKGQKSLLFHIYNESQKKESEFSEKYGLRMIKIYKYLLKAGIDYIIRPVILFKDENGKINEVEDHQYEDILGSKNKITPSHKILPYMTYSHVLPTGRVMEFLFQPLLDNVNIEDIYNETTHFRKSFILSEQLNKELSQEENSSKKRVKI